MECMCKECPKWRFKQAQALEDCESIFDAASDIINFEKECAKTCSADNIPENS